MWKFDVKVIFRNNFLEEGIFVQLKEYKEGSCL